MTEFVRIDPRYRFGRPNVRGVDTWIIRQRFCGGETAGEIAKDYDLPPAAVELALRYELTKRRKNPIGVRR